ncbi:PH domain-containing protein, partial [Cronobacter sakazakii]|uniref:PH domain-containing protein n=1 Tax=Cronobacter sakazakii TaxID=28141 RepID=UPI001A99F248
LSLKGKFPFWYLVPIGFAVITIVSAIVGWYYKVYWIENNVLHVKQGLFVKKESYLNKERVQTINTSSNVLYQMLGLKKIQIETAGGGDDAEVSLAGITEEEAKELISLLNEPTPEVKAEETSEEVVEKKVMTEEKQATEYKLTLKEILLASVTSGQFGLLFSLIFFVYHQVDEYIPKWIKNSVESYVMDHDIYGWIYMVAILLVLSWIISTIGYALKHGNFTVNRKNDEVRISQE